MAARGRRGLSRYAFRKSQDTHFETVRLPGASARLIADRSGRSFSFGPGRRLCAPRIIWPGMLGITSAELLSYTLISRVPEIAQIPRHLDGTAVRGQQREDHGLA